MAQSEATDLSKDGTLALHFKLHGQKHSFEAQNAPERNGWFIAIEKAIAEGNVAKEGIVASETYKEELAKLGKSKSSTETRRVHRKTNCCIRLFPLQDAWLTNRRQTRHASRHDR
jgi:hypothetical protein